QSGRGPRGEASGTLALPREARFERLREIAARAALLRRLQPDAPAARLGLDELEHARTVLVAVGARVEVVGERLDQLGSHAELLPIGRAPLADVELLDRDDLVGVAERDEHRQPV